MAVTGALKKQFRWRSVYVNLTGRYLIQNRRKERKPVRIRKFFQEVGGREVRPGAFFRMGKITVF